MICGRSMRLKILIKRYIPDVCTPRVSSTCLLGSVSSPSILSFTLIRSWTWQNELEHFEVHSACHRWGASFKITRVWKFVQLHFSTPINITSLGLDEGWETQDSDRCFLNSCLIWENMGWFRSGLSLIYNSSHNSVPCIRWTIHKLSSMHDNVTLCELVQRLFSGTVVWQIIN